MCLINFFSLFVSQWSAVSASRVFRTSCSSSTSSSHSLCPDCLWQSHWPLLCPGQCHAISFPDIQPFSSDPCPPCFLHPFPNPSSSRSPPSTSTWAAHTPPPAPSLTHHARCPCGSTGCPQEGSGTSHPNERCTQRPAGGHQTRSEVTHKVGFECYGVKWWQHHTFVCILFLFFCLMITRTGSILCHRLKTFILIL